jgi:tripartite-type tricarboxylate transporter receptor subunit TctC
MPTMRDVGLRFAASIRRGLAAPAAISDGFAESLAAALREVAADPEFHAAAESDGFIAVWLDGPAWTAQAVSEQTELARLWHDDPWRPSGIL